MATSSEKEPDSKLGHLAGLMLGYFEQVRPRGVKCVLMFDDPDESHSMVALSGYENDLEATAAMSAHLAAIFEANGKKLMIFPINHD